MRTCVLACVCFLLAGAAAAQPVPAGTAAGSDSRTTASVAASADTAASPPRPQPAWAAIPSQDQMQDEYPADAERQGVAGKATLQCALMPDGHVTDCVAISEDPAGYGFGAAARRLAPQFRMTTGSCGPEGCGQVRIPVVFQPDLSASPAARRAETAAAWTRLTRFLEAAGLLLAVGIAILFWWMRTPEDDLAAIRTAIGSDGPGALSIRRRGQMTHRPSGGACRTYNVVVPALDGGEHTLMVGVRRRMFGKGPVTLFDRNGHAIRTLPRPRDEPAAIAPHGQNPVAPLVPQAR